MSCRTVRFHSMTGSTVGGAAASARWGVAKPKPAATTEKAMVAVNAKGLWRIIWDNSARVVGSALMTVDFRRPRPNRTNLVSCWARTPRFRASGLLARDVHAAPMRAETRFARTRLRPSDG